MRLYRPFRHDFWLLNISPEALLLLGSLVSRADDEGRFCAADARQLRSGSALIDASDEKIEELLKELAEPAAGRPPMIELYAIGGVRYGWMPGWKDRSSPLYQVVQRPSPSRIPVPEAQPAT